MATNASAASPANVQAPQPAPQPVPAVQQALATQPLWREGAMFILTPEEKELEDAMLRSSLAPEPSDVLGKRPRSNNDGNTEPESDDETTPHCERSALGNLTTAMARYAKQKRLRLDQHGEVNAFLLDSALGRQARLYVCLLAVENKIDTFKSAAPPFQVSDELKTNISNYAIAVLLSSEISAYKGDIPRNHILNILKRFHFGLPLGIEHDLSSWEKISKEVSYCLTQTRAKVKKLIRDSIEENTNIFALSQVIVNGMPCHVTVQLCSRVALMWAIHPECSGDEKYWNKIDEHLSYIRRVAGSDKVKMTRAFKKILTKDRATYGADEDYQIGDTICNDLQQWVDDVVAGILQPQDS